MHRPQEDLSDRNKHPAPQPQKEDPACNKLYPTVVKPLQEKGVGRAQTHSKH